MVKRWNWMTLVSSDRMLPVLRIELIIVMKINFVNFFFPLVFERGDAFDAVGIFFNLKRDSNNNCRCVWCRRCHISNSHPEIRILTWNPNIMNDRFQTGTRCGFNLWLTEGGTWHGGNWIGQDWNGVGWYIRNTLSIVVKKEQEQKKGAFGTNKRRSPLLTYWAQKNTRTIVDEFPSSFQMASKLTLTRLYLNLTSVRRHRTKDSLSAGSKLRKDSHKNPARIAGESHEGKNPWRDPFGIPSLPHSKNLRHASRGLKIT